MSVSTHCVTTASFGPINNDGFDFEPIYTHTGSSVWEPGNRNQTYLFFVQQPVAAYTFIRYEVTATRGNTAHQINEIEYFGSSGPAPGPSNSRSPTSGAGTSR